MPFVRIPRSRSMWLGLIGTLLLLLGAGCANYHLGTGAQGKTYATIYLAPVTNTAAVPQAVAPVSRELRAAFVRDGRLKLAHSAAEADLLLEIDLASFSRSFTAVQATDTALARKFDLHLKAKCTLVDQRTQQALWSDREISVTRQIFVDDGQGPAEYQAIPLLAEQLSDRALHAVLDVW